MHNLSLNQVLSLWSDLEKAYHGTHGFGGDTAEIYIYRLMPFEPAIMRDPKAEEHGIIGSSAREAYERANKSLFKLLSKFAKDRDAAITVDEKELGPWLKTARNTHRVHVKVVPRKR